MATQADSLAVLLEENRIAGERLRAALQETQERIGGRRNLNELNKNPNSRSALPFEKMVNWVGSGAELEGKVWEFKKEYELGTNPRHENLSAMINMFISQGYDLTISDQHFVLSLPTERQSYSGRWFVGWDQELHIYAKKADEEVMVKKEVVWCGPITFWYTGMHYLINIYKNKSQIDDKTLLNVIEYGEPKPGFIPGFMKRIAKPQDIDGHVFERWTHDYVYRS